MAKTLFRDPTTGAILRNPDGSLIYAESCCCYCNTGNCYALKSCDTGDTTNYGIPCDQLTNPANPGDVVGNSDQCYEITAINQDCTGLTTPPGDPIDNCEGTGCEDCDCGGGNTEDCYPLVPCEPGSGSCSGCGSTVPPTVFAGLATGIDDGDVGSVVEYNGRCYTVQAKTTCDIGTPITSGVTIFAGDCVACLAQETNPFGGWACPGDIPDEVTLVLPDLFAGFQSCQCQDVFGMGHTLSLDLNSVVACRPVWVKEIDSCLLAGRKIRLEVTHSVTPGIGLEAVVSFPVNPAGQSTMIWRREQTCANVHCSGSIDLQPVTTSTELCTLDPLDNCFTTQLNCPPEHDVTVIL